MLFDEGKVRCEAGLTFFFDCGENATKVHERFAQLTISTVNPQRFFSRKEKANNQ